MPTFKFTDPDGKLHTVTGPEGATADQAYAILQKQLEANKPAMQVAKERAVEDLAQTGTGAMHGVSGLLGLPGTLQDVLPKFLRGGEFGAGGKYGQHAPTPGDINDFASNLTGITTHPPTTGEGRYLRAGAEGLTSAAGSGGIGLASGTLSGILGQLAEDYVKGGRVVGNMAGYIPQIASSLIKPWDVKGLGQWMSRIGKPELESAGASAANAAEGIGVKATDLSAQEPRLRGLMDDLEKSKYGRPIQEMRADAANANPANMNWNSGNLHDIGNVYSPKVGASLPGVMSDVEKAAGSSSWGALSAIPFAGETLANFMSSGMREGRMKSLGETMASPEAGEYLSKLLDYSKPKDVISAIAKSLASTTAQNTADTPLRIDITGGANSP